MTGNGIDFNFSDYLCIFLAQRCRKLFSDRPLLRELFTKNRARERSTKIGTLALQPCNDCCKQPCSCIPLCPSACSLFALFCFKICQWINDIIVWLWMLLHTYQNIFFRPRFSRTLWVGSMFLCKFFKQGMLNVYLMLIASTCKEKGIPGIPT